MAVRVRKATRTNLLDINFSFFLTLYILNSAHDCTSCSSPCPRPEAVPLVDAFDHSDKMLDSVLGCYDGRVYERMYEWARRAPSNKKQVSSRCGLPTEFCAS